jgi:hypothetical protein
MRIEQREWAAFIALIPYFSTRPGRANIRDRLMTSLRQCGEPVITRDALLLRSGLSFFAEDFDVDLAVMQLIRDGVILPVVDAPFTFVIEPSRPKGEQSCAPSQSKPAAACG